MPADDNWQKVHSFLVEQFKTQEPFTQSELERVTTWTGQSIKTYWSKQIRQFLEPVGNDRYRVTEAFRRMATWERFQRHASQMRPMVCQYTSLIYENVIIYEFFMPLSNEEHLRSSLDALFYADTIVHRLRTVDADTLTKHFPQNSGECFDDYLKRTAEWLSARIGGYSISHVNGRFKTGTLATVAEAARMQVDGDRYLVDETTAVVKFIFPCGKPFERKPPLNATHFEEVSAVHTDNTGVIEDASRIRWFFGVLFVKSIVQVVNGEAEIWMVESGMRHRLHIWRVESEPEGKNRNDSQTSLMLD